MATFDEAYYKDAPFYHPTGGSAMAGRTTARSYANGDIVRLHKVERDTKIGDAVVAPDRLDTNGTPTATGELELYDGTTTVSLVSLTTTNLGSATAASRMARTTNPASIGYVVPTRGFWLQFRFTAAFATAASGSLGFSVQRTNVLTGAESPLVPTG